MLASPLRLVAGAALSSSAIRALHQRHDPDVGVLVVTLRPATRRIGWVANDLLAALGKTHLHAGTGRDADRDWALTPIWLAAHQIRDVVLLDTDHLAPALLRQTLRTLIGLHIRVWIVVGDTVGESTATALADWPASAAHLDDLHAALPTPAAPLAAGSADPVHAWPASVPDADFPVYRAACRDQLPADQFTVVDACYRDTLARAAARLDDEPISQATLRDLLADEVAATRTDTELTTRVRAVQAATFIRGVLLAVNRYELLAAQPAAPRRAAADPTTWQRLRAYRSPHQALACALTAAGLPTTEQRSLTIADASADGAHLTDDATIALPAGSEPFLRAQRLLRLASDANPSDPLLTDPRGTPVGDRAIATAVNDAMREHGIPLINSQVIRRRPGDGRWLAGRGFALTHLTSKAP